MLRNDIRNVAIIAHVDHGKTTLVDAMLRQSHVFRENEQVADRVMDSTISNGNAEFLHLSEKYGRAVQRYENQYRRYAGAPDFGGEVERILNMVDGVVLLVDAFEGDDAADEVCVAESVGAASQADCRHQ